LYICHCEIHNLKSLVIFLSYLLNWQNAGILNQRLAEKKTDHNIWGLP
jgi:hypothetical protein